MKGSEKEEKSSVFGRGDFVEIDTGSVSRGLPTVRIDGPYGAPAEDVFDVEVAVLIGAGIGTCINPNIQVVPHISAEAEVHVLCDRCHPLRFYFEAYLVPSA